MIRTMGLVGAASLFISLGCGDSQLSTPAPTAPIPVGTALAVFSDGAGFSTSDVYDSDNELIRFETNENALWWVGDNLLFDGWTVSGDFLDPQRLYRVRFGTVGGAPRAYFTEAGRGTLCDLSVVDNILRIEPTNLLPP